MTELMRKLTKQDIRNTLAVSVIVFFFITLWKLTATVIPDSNKDLVMVVVGSLTATVSAIVGYYFGQSKSETDAKKQDSEQA